MIKNGRFLLNKDNIKLSFLADGKGGFIEILLMGTKKDLNNVKQQLIEDQKLRELIEKEVTWSNKNILLSKSKMTRDFFKFIAESLTSLLKDSKK